MTKDGIIVGLDVGSTKVTVIVGEAAENNEIYILGSGVAQTTGIKKGMIVNIEETVSSIERAIADAEHIADVDIDTVYVSVGGYHIEGQNTRGRVVIPPNQKEITTDDKLHVQDAARAIQLPPNTEILHVLPEEYKVDDQDGIIDPIGMAGSQLEVGAHVITGLTPSVRNLQKSVRGSGLKIKEMVFEGICSAEAVLTPDEKELGVALVDIGGGTTDVVVYVGGFIRHSTVLPLGSSHITSDISIGLRTSAQEAEKIKVRHGLVWEEGVDLDAKVEVPNAGNDGVRQVELRQILEIIEPRMEEIFTMIRDEIRNSGCASAIPAGMVLTGGGALMNGLQKFSERFLEMPVRVGKPANIAGLAEKVNAPGYSTCVGLIAYALRQEAVPRHSFIHQSGIVDGVMGWLKSFFKDVF